MSKMPIIDELGRFRVIEGTLKPIESEHPVYKARIAVAIDKGSWLHAPATGHTLGVYAKGKATAQKSDEFQKSAALYLAPYGPEVIGRLVKRGELSIAFRITRETLKNG
jgi:hypothetical protein